jgi:hypothetical protein
MARLASSFIQQRWPKSSYHRQPSPPTPPERNGQSSNNNNNNNNAKRSRLDPFHTGWVYWNNFYYMTTALVKVRSLGTSMILIAILGILLFHPPCYRQRAKGMPLCRISRDLGIIPPLPPKNSNKSQVTINLRRGRKSQKPKPSTSKIVLGFMSFGNDEEERQRRATLRKEFLLARDNGKQVCSLQNYLADAKQYRDCRIVYSFLQGGNAEGTHLDFNKTYLSTLKYELTSFFVEDQQRQHSQRFPEHDDQSSNGNFNKEEDITFLNVQDLNNVRKVFAWFDYTTRLKVAKFRQFDYIGFTNTHYSLDIDRFLANDVFESSEITENTYGGILWQKSNCHKQQKNLAAKNMDCTEACPKIPNDNFMSDFVVLSRDLISYCLAHSNLVQLSGVYPQNCPDLTIARLLGFHLSQDLNMTHLEGIISS